MTKFFHTDPREESFLWIKQTLDPSASYIVFENELNAQEGSIFDPAHMAYGYLEKEKFFWQQVIDMDVSREYLVIRIPIGQEDKVLAKAMGCGFSENTICYIFKAKEVRK
ncbi:MAG: hypothetical protein KKF12_13250 [Proteobacteria bacterium]|nr:hypothetical protein [Desulfobacula sp.]MBU3951990.1 hypothetical protein [Pseudomonadota bacterium]MBU4131781.1 hypothetical protein [Pseudomonadota bacterium]